MERRKEIKSKPLNVTLTEELWKFVQSQSGDTLYCTASEYGRDLIRHEKERLDAEAIRESILAGLQDAIHGRTIPFSGDLRTDLALAKKKFSDPSN